MKTNSWFKTHAHVVVVHVWTLKCTSLDNGDILLYRSHMSLSLCRRNVQNLLTGYLLIFLIYVDLRFTLYIYKTYTLLICNYVILSRLISLYQCITLIYIHVTCTDIWQIFININRKYFNMLPLQKNFFYKIKTILLKNFYRSEFFALRKRASYLGLAYFHRDKQKKLGKKYYNIHKYLHITNIWII